MSRAGRPAHYATRKLKPEAGDEKPPYSETQLRRFDFRFRTRLLSAFERGLEHPESAAAQWPPAAINASPLSTWTARRRTASLEQLANA